MRVEFKGSSEEYIKSKPKERFYRLKWWFILLVIAGLIAAAIAFVRETNQIRSLSQVGTQLQSPSLVALLPIAFLQETGAGTDGREAAKTTKEKKPESIPNELVRSYIMVGIFIMIGIVTLASLFTVLFGRSERSVAVASDLLKTCVGFFIGVATGWL